MLVAATVAPEMTQFLATTATAAYRLLLVARGIVEKLLLNQQSAKNYTPTSELETMQKFASRGQHHHRAKLTDADIDRMRLLHGEFPRGHPHHLGYRRLARMFEVSRGCVQWVCTGRQRV